jgi:uncharacterized membrane protein YdbT with pleckstrin-like domain
MSDVERGLSPGERVVYRTGLHWIVYGAALGPIGVAVAGAVASSVAPGGAVRSALLLLATLALAAGVVQLLATWARIRMTEIVVTDRRVIYASGVFGRRSIGMNRDKIESVVIDQSVAGRLLGFGTVVIRGVGAGLEPVANVVAPMEFRRQVGA